MTTWNISSRLGMTGTVDNSSGLYLSWDINSITPFTFGGPNTIPLVGDWDGNGIEGIGVYEPASGTFFLKQTASAGNADITVQFGPVDLTPISWYDTVSVPNHDQIGIKSGSTVFLNKGFHPGNADIITTTDNVSCDNSYVRQCAYAISNVWTINSRLGMHGIVTAETTDLRWNITSVAGSSLSTPLNFTFGGPNAIPLVGDWNGTGEGIGVYDPVGAVFYLKYDLSLGDANYSCQYGTVGNTPLSWYDSVNHRDGFGVIGGSDVYLDQNLTCGAGEINATIGDMSCPSSGIIRQCTYTAPTPVLTTIIVSPSSISIPSSGSQAFTAAPKDQHGDPISATITWSNSNPLAGSINSSTGLFSATSVIANTITTVTATSGTIHGTATVTVLAPAPVLASISSRLGMVGTVTIVPEQYLQWHITSISGTPLSTPLDFTFGGPNTIPLIGDWDGNGMEGIGVYAPADGTFFLKQTASAGDADITFQFGSGGQTPISWYDTVSVPNHDQIGVISGSNVYLNNGFHYGAADIMTTTDNVSCDTSHVKQCTYAVSIVGIISSRLGMQGIVTAETTDLRWNITSVASVPLSTPLNFTFGEPNNIPLVGDWNGTGEGIGVYDPIEAMFHLKYDLSSGYADYPCKYGSVGDTPLSWYDSVSNRDGFGVISGSDIHLDRNLACGTSEINATTADILCPSPGTIGQCIYTAPPAEEGGSGILIGALAIGALAMMMSKK
jgi:hypothetical protein